MASMGWRKRIVLLFGIYLFAYLFVHAIINRKVIIDRQSVDNTNDGPLIVKFDANIHDTGGIGNRILVRSVLMLNNAAVDDSSVEAPSPTIADDFEQVFIDQASSIDTNDFVLFTIINRAYTQLMLNWLCNTALFDGIHRRTLIVSLDADTCATIIEQWSNVSCIHLQLNTTVGFNSALDWGRQPYIDLLAIRIRLMLALVSARIDFVLFESDSIWFRNPIDYFRNRTLIDDADIVVPVRGRSDKYGHTLTFDPMLVYSSNTSRQLFIEIDRRLRLDRSAYDQDVLDELCTRQYYGVVCRTFAYADVADGWWMKAESERRNREQRRPFIVNNNFYTGVDNKMTRQALAGLWFIDTKHRCSMRRVRYAIDQL